MLINIRLDKNFTTQYNKLQSEYGTEMAKLNGFDDKQLSYTDFIDNFVDEPIVADSSIDGNSNVKRKDIVTLLTEMPKPHRKLLAFNKIYYEFHKLYGFKAANEWLFREWTGQQYTHDADTTTFKSYCFAYDITDLTEKGLFFLDETFNAKPPKHLTTLIDFIKEYINFASNRTSGAVGLPNIIPYMYFLWKEDVNSDYLGIKSSGQAERYARQNIQRFIYAVNQPCVRDGQQSAFTNTSVFDREYLSALFGGAKFPNGEYMIDYIEEIMDFQKLYMEVMSDIRSENMFTFPVSTISLVRKDGKFADEDFAEWAIKHNMTWSDSNLFIDDSVSSLSNCCFDGSQKCLTKSSNGVNYTTFEDLYESAYKDTKQNLTIFHNGNWVKGKLIRLPGRKMYKVVTTNNKEMILTDNHINATLEGDKDTTSLRTEDYLMFNTKKLNAVHEADNDLTYEQGFLIGMYLGDGSMQDEDGSNTTTVHFSLNETKYDNSLSLIRAAVGEDIEVRLGKVHNNVYPVSIRDNNIADFVREFVSGKYSFEKHLNPNCILQSIAFRKGVLDGYYLTDGGNSNRIYTTSHILVEDIEMLCTSLGLQTIIDVSDRTGDDKVVIRGKSFNRNYPVYCIRWYESYKRKQNNVYKWKNNSIYFKIKSIEEINETPQYVYCFEMENSDEPYFTLPNGIITHNCRLKSNIEDLGYFNSIGGTALKVGSVKVVTLNLARLALDTNTKEEFLEELKNRTLCVVRTLHVIRNILKRNVEKGLLPNFTHGLIDFDHLYNTIGFIGCYETMKKFGCTTIDELGNTFYTDDATIFGEQIFKTIREVADKFIEDNQCDYMINTEQIPGENAAAKLMRKDKFFYPDAAIYDLPLYGNQFIPLGIKTTLQERVRVQALFDKFCNGGSILHANIDAPFDSFEKAYDMTCYIADAGVTYFAWNTKIQACEDNHAFYGTTCPTCGKPVNVEFTRIVGFYTPIKSWSTERKEEYKLRKWEEVNK